MATTWWEMFVFLNRFPCTRHPEKCVFRGHFKASKLEMWVYFLKDPVRDLSHQTLSQAPLGKQLPRSGKWEWGESFRLFHILLPRSTFLTQHFPHVSQRKKEMETWYIYFLHTCQLWPLLAVGEQEINDGDHAMEKAIRLYITIFCF